MMTIENVLSALTITIITRMPWGLAVVGRFGI